MGKNKTGTGRKYVTFLLTEEEYNYIFERAKGPGCSVSQFGGLIVRYWFKDKAPSLDKHDKVIPVPEFPRMAHWLRVKKPSP